jgi:hypothetical protein
MRGFHVVSLSLSKEMHIRCRHCWYGAVYSHCDLWTEGPTIFKFSNEVDGVDDTVIHTVIQDMHVRFVHSISGDSNCEF